MQCHDAEMDEDEYGDDTVTMMMQMLAMLVMLMMVTMMRLTLLTVLYAYGADVC